MAEIVADKKTGLHFAAGDASDLARVVAWASQHSAELADIGRNARKTYEALYTPERNYQLLLDIYNHAITQPLL
jgi:glycosyltransferase involved in cell wall biosynthesis